ncbi:hypothetical protein [Bacillus sp. 1P02SD]|uniref:hypothetical protein n=1 Tax=Bacillus sp. 1P02SD TaxID=3132264 RepID=UPI0039A0EFFF
MKKDNDNSFDPDDTYGVFKSEMEVDSDVNEDMNRERLLDESVEAFMKSKKISLNSSREKGRILLNLGIFCL